MSHLRLLSIASFLLAWSSVVSGEEPTPTDWQNMIWRSTAIVTAVVELPRIQVVRPEKDVERSVDGRNGRRVIVLPSPNDYLVGELTQFSVETVHKKRPGVPLKENVDVFYPAHAAPALQVGQRMLLFLQNPIAFDALMIERYKDWSGLLGTILKYPRQMDRPAEPFAVASAYSLVFPEPSVPNALEFTPENQALIEAALAQIGVAAEPSKGSVKDIKLVPVLDDETALLGPDRKISEALGVVTDDEEPHACGVKPAESHNR